MPQNAVENITTVTHRVIYSSMVSPTAEKSTIILLTILFSAQKFWFKVKSISPCSLFFCLHFLLLRYLSVWLKILNHKFEWITRIEIINHAYSCMLLQQTHISTNQEGNLFGQVSSYKSKLKTSVNITTTSVAFILFVWLFA